LDKMRFIADRGVADDILDGLLWFAIPATLLWFMHVGGISGDGVAQSALYTRGAWHINPNHLLYEPIGAAWLHISRAVVEPYASEQLRRLSAIAGAISLALFRLFVASQVTGERARANVATAWLVAPAAVLGLWLSSETQIVQLRSSPINATCCLDWARGWHIHAFLYLKCANLRDIGGHSMCDALQSG
jgi:hypothetical protein